MTTRTILAAIAVTALLVSACGTDDLPPRATEITIIENADGTIAFEPDAITADAGTDIVYINRTDNQHNIVFSDGGPTSPAIRPGASHKLTMPTQPGEYAYFSILAGSGQPGGVVWVVTPPPTTTTAP